MQENPLPETDLVLGNLSPENSIEEEIEVQEIALPDNSMQQQLISMNSLHESYAQALNFEVVSIIAISQ